MEHSYSYRVTVKLIHDHIVEAVSGEEAEQQALDCARRGELPYEVVDIEIDDVVSLKMSK
jgi:hypothetical protein